MKNMKLRHTSLKIQKKNEIVLFVNWKRVKNIVLADARGLRI